MNYFYELQKMNIHIFLYKRIEQTIHFLVNYPFKFCNFFKIQVL